MKIATLLQNKHDSIQQCPFTASESFNDNIVDKNMPSPYSILVLFYVIWASLGTLWTTWKFLLNKSEPQKCSIIFIYNTIKLVFSLYVPGILGFKRCVQILAFVWKWNAMVPLYSLSIEHVNLNLWKWNFDRLCVFDFFILSVNCSHVRFIYLKVYEKISSGGLEVSLSILCVCEQQRRWRDCVDAQARLSICCISVR